MTTKKNIGIINCDFGNLASLINAVKFLKFDYQILDRPSNLNNFSHLILPGVGSFNSPFYFIHSFRVLHNKKISQDKSKKYSTTFYGEEFISFVENKKIFGAQFHPEKSHKTGLKLINNFITEIS